MQLLQHGIKKVGETVKRDEVLVEIETDKVVLEVPALSDGVVVEILQEEGATVVSKQLLGKLSTQQAGDISTETVKDNEPTPADRQEAAIEIVTIIQLIKVLLFVVY